MKKMMLPNSRNRFPLVGIYKETKNKPKKRSTNQVHTKSKVLSRHPTATTSVLPRISLGSFTEKISAACPTCNISQQVSDLTLTIGQEEQQLTKNCLVAAAELHQIIVEYWSWRLEQAPEFATMCGVHKFDDRLSSYSLVAIEQRVEQCKVFVERLNRINVRKLSKDDRLNLKLIKVDLESYIEGYPWRFHSAFNAVNFMENIPLDFGTFLIDAMKFENGEDYNKYLSRLRAIPVQVDEEIELMRQAIEYGTTLHECSLGRTIRHLEEMVSSSAEECPFFTPFAPSNMNKDISTESWNTIAAEGKAVIEDVVFPALLRLHAFLKTEYLPRTRSTPGVAGLKDGSAFYSACLKWHLTISMDPKEVHEIGLQEVARIQDQMKSVMKEAGFDGKLSQFMQILKMDSRFYHDNGDDLLKEYRQILKDIIIPRIPDLFTRIPNYPLEIVPLPHPGPGAQYIPASADGKRPGQFQVGLERPESTPRFTMMPLTLHECMPGHHLQYTHAMSQQLPQFRKGRDYRRIFGAPLLFPVYTAYDEGWALYAEYLGEEMGVYRDCFERFGRHSEEMVRAVRLVVDTGLHLFNWTPNEAIEYMSDNTCLSREDIVEEIDRYITWPGQACAYKIGELTIKRLRRLVEEQLGSAFDVKKFHDVVLGLGAVPLSVLETEVIEWLNESLRPTTDDEDDEE